jgi:beta-N-acetylglucosaminidase
VSRKKHIILTLAFALAIVAFLVFAIVADAAEPNELLTPCGYTAEELEIGLRGELKPLADTFIAAEKETGVNAIFLASVAALESGWGKSNLAEEKNNLYGWRGASGYRWFWSKESCINHVARFLKKHYLSPDGKYYSGATVEGVCVRYNGCDEWSEMVRQIMNQIERRIERAESDL